jgi:PAS domain S-box-containing protein
MGMINTGDDITSRNVLEQGRKENENQLSAINDIDYEARLTINHYGEIISWNRGAETIFGYSSDELIGNSMAPLIPKRYRKDHQQLLLQIQTKSLASQFKQTFKMIGLTKEGREFPIEISLARWTSSNQLYLTALVRDSSD